MCGKRSKVDAILLEIWRSVDTNELQFNKLAGPIQVVERAVTLGALTFTDRPFMHHGGRLSRVYFGEECYDTSHSIRRLIADLRILFADKIESLIKRKRNVPLVDVICSYEGKEAANAQSLVTELYIPNVDMLELVYFRRGRFRDSHPTGRSLRGKRVLLFDSYLMSGRSLWELIKLVQSEGGTVVSVIVAFDRMEKRFKHDSLSAKCRIEREFNIPIVSLINFEDVVTYLMRTMAMLCLQSRSSADKTVLDRLIRDLDKYRREYGILAKA